MLPQWEVGNFKRVAYDMKYIPKDHRAQRKKITAIRPNLFWVSMTQTEGKQRVWL